MRQDLQLDSRAHRLVFQLLLHVAALVHIQKELYEMIQI